MGVPSFYRWLCRKYPRVALEAIEERPVIVNGQEIPVDATKPNPNKFEIDNLYLDMNGIIHPCCRPSEAEGPLTEEDMIIRVFAYVDRIFDIVRPRKIIYMAIDGVAPRAKMNQQRQRRFRAAQARDETTAVEDYIKKLLKDAGKEDCIPTDRKHSWDTNVITPGTLFMSKLSKALQYYIVNRIENNPAWKNLKVIFSDARVPGEGEHKIMEFIRNQRVQKDYNPDTTHCLYGMDADLIMLGLASHETKFYIIREVVLTLMDKICFLCSKAGHTAGECSSITQKLQEAKDNEYIIPNSTPVPPPVGQEPYQFLDLSILREYLQHDLYIDAPWWNLENAIDDWILLCFFVGNDFLPHLPSLEIREGAIDVLTQIHARVISQCNSFLTLDGSINFDNLAILVQVVGMMEETILARRLQFNRMMQPRDVAAFRDQNIEELKIIQEEYQQWKTKNAATITRINTTECNTTSAKEQKQRLDKQRKGYDDEIDTIVQRFISKIQNVEDFKTVVKNVGTLTELAEKSQDIIQLGYPGYHQRYYKNMGLNTSSTNNHLKNMLTNYAQGLSWVFQYYFNGCPSWSWYYPYHYSPLAFDLSGIDTYNLEIEENKTIFTPFQQLLSVLPAASSHALPDSFARLMLEPTSKISDFYPLDFGLDTNNRKYKWQGVVLLPFIDSKRLMQVSQQAASEINVEETERNTLGVTYIYFHKDNSLGDVVNTFQSRKLSIECDDPVNERRMADEDSTNCVEVGHQNYQIAGYISPMYNAVTPESKKYSLPFKYKGYKSVRKPSVYSMTYRLATSLPHYCYTLPDATPVPAALGPLDFDEKRHLRKNRTENSLFSLTIYDHDNLNCRAGQRSGYSEPFYLRSLRKADSSILTDSSTVGIGLSAPLKPVTTTTMTKITPETNIVSQSTIFDDKIRYIEQDSKRRKVSDIKDAKNIKGKENTIEKASLTAKYVNISKNNDKTIEYRVKGSFDAYATEYTHISKYNDGQTCLMSRPSHIPKTKHIYIENTITSQHSHISQGEQIGCTANQILDKNLYL